MLFFRCSQTEDPPTNPLPRQGSQAIPIVHNVCIRFSYTACTVQQRGFPRDNKRGYKKRKKKKKKDVDGVVDGGCGAWWSHSVREVLILVLDFSW